MDSLINKPKSGSMRDTSQDSLMIQQHGGLRVSGYDVPDLAEDDCK